MLDQLRQIAIFAKTVEEGSFRGAARVLRLSPSVVSHHIRQLERSLGTPLLYRSTRRLSLTHDGERLLSSAARMLQAAEEGLESISQDSAQPSGELRVTIPAVLAQSALVERIAGFAQDHPRVRLKLDFSDARRDLTSEGYDLAIRMGWLEDSALKARKLGDVARYLVASASYLANKPVPEGPQDIESWNWLGLTPVTRSLRFRRTGSRAVTINPKEQMLANSAFALRQLGCAGAGLATLPAFIVEDDLSNGTLRRVLPDWLLESIGVYAVWQPNATRQGLTARLVKSLVDKPCL